MRRFSIGYGTRPQEWKIETPHGTIQILSKKGVITVLVSADGNRFPSEGFKEVTVSYIGTTNVTVELSRWSLDSMKEDS